jgi:hypothetical protein
MSLLVSFLYLCLHIAVILLIAAVIVWLCKWLGVPLDGTVLKIGQIVVALLVLIAVVVWLGGVLGWSSYRWPWQP